MLDNGCGDRYNGRMTNAPTTSPTALMHTQATAEADHEERLLRHRSLLVAIVADLQAMIGDDPTPDPRVVFGLEAAQETLVALGGGRTPET